LFLAKGEAGIGNAPDVERAEQLEEEVRLGVEVFAWIEAVCVVLFTFEYMGRLVTTWARPEPWQQQVSARWEDECEDAMEEDEDGTEEEDEDFVRFLTSPPDTMGRIGSGPGGMIGAANDIGAGEGHGLGEGLDGSGLGGLVMRWDALSSSSPTRIKRTRTGASDAMRAAMEGDGVGLRVRRASRVSMPATVGVVPRDSPSPKTDMTYGSTTSSKRSSPDLLREGGMPLTPTALLVGEGGSSSASVPVSGRADGDGDDAVHGATQAQRSTGPLLSSDHDAEREPTSAATAKGSPAISGAVIEVEVPRVSPRRLWTRRCRAADHMLRARGALYLAAESARIAADAAGPAARITALDFAGDGQ